MEVKLTGRFGLGFNANFEIVLECAKTMLTAKEEEEVFLDFSDVKFLYPSGINVLVAIGRYLQYQRKCSISQNFPKDKEVCNFLDESGFSKEVGVSVPMDSNIPAHNVEYIYKMRQFTWLNNFEVEKLLDVIEKELQMSPAVRRDVHESLTELILNVKQHSNSPFDCYIIGQGYPTTHRIRFCIADGGIGIKKHLGRKYEDLLNKNSTEAIEKALIEGITGTVGNENSGLGLTYFKDFVIFCGGSFTILSGDGLYYEETDIFKQPKKYSLNFEFPGTLIDFTINSKPNIKLFRKTEEVPKEYRLIK